ncbi:SRPBCC family protein [Chitinophaga sp. GCM10012297]|uniref:SRPBCC family protein n=1 Tax=Chitinophaga chungangae TaxID=2821488 RepID=A0ABS3YGC0_9BACT|nr:SRPBCC family protein [Chitinophaga chungangae]MBO9153732.1 SRPBCC family protein [Chitinophaga chungangae]
MQQALMIILGAVAVIVLGLFVFATYLPSRVRVERSLLIRAPAGRIFSFVNTLRNWPQWSPWHREDPQMKVEYSPTDSGQGAAYSWKSRNRNIGKGSLKITESRTNEYIANEMNFMQQGPVKGYFRFRSAATGTLVTWGMETDVGQNPVRKLIGNLVNKWVGSDFEKGLSNLKRLSEI